MTNDISSEVLLETQRGERDRRQRRRDRVILISLVEIMTVMTFIAVGFAFVTQQQVDFTRDWREEAKRLEIALKSETTARQKAEEDRETLKQQLAALWEAYRGEPLPANPKEIEDFIKRLRDTGIG